MTKTERVIDEALAQEERELLYQMGEEPGHVQQALALFDGRNGWVNMVMMAAQLALFVAGVWAAWNFFATSDPVSAIHWGIPAAVALMMSLMIKLALYPTMQNARLLAELKRLEIQIEHGRAR